jgi:stress response protein SCP2
MGIFTKKEKDPQGSVTTEAPEASSVAQPTSGKVNLHKGQSLRLTKDSDRTAQITAINNWKNPRKDYDLKALVLFKDGRQVYVGAANRDEILQVADGAVRHHGDVKAGSKDGEEITITWHPDIESVALSSYSALENGPGSFREYGVSVRIVNGPEVVEIAAEETNASRTSYTLYFGRVDFNPDGSLTLRNQEQYSRSGSENRIKFVKGEVRMDAGPEGQRK